MIENKMPARTDNQSGGPANWKNQDLAEAKLLELFRGMVEYPSFSALKVDVRVMKDSRKEVILEFGKHYRFVLANPDIRRDKRQ